MSDLEHTATVERREWSLFRKQRETISLASPEKIVLLCLLIFYGGILAGAILYILIGGALHFGRMATDALGLVP